MKKKAKKPTKKSKMKKLDKQDKILLITLVLLIILVIALLISALNLKNKESKKANITIPILEKQTKNEISVDLSEMASGETKEYIFKVSNFKDKVVNEKNANYNILITPSKNAIVELYKKGSTKNLVAKNVYEIENNKLPKNKKTEDEYHMIIKTTKTPNKTDKIVLKINS